LFLSVQAVCGQPLQGWQARSLFQFLKYFTNHLTLLAPMKVSPYVC
jgi:hypothetical protein